MQDSTHDPPGTADDPTAPVGPGRTEFDTAPIARDARAHGLVVVAGAGLSMGPPSSLPGWVDINNAFLHALAMRVARHTRDGVGISVAKFIAERRDTAAIAQPDLQAQLAEETLGDHYFALFRPLDIETWNDGHAALALLAASGTLRAIVTTNFDRLIELALRKAEIPFDVLADSAEFDRLTDWPASAPLPVIKVHGSVERPATMVDTLRQRVVGRPPSLEAALARLFARHAVLTVGLSGADLAHDPHYLGLREGAAGSPSFTILNRAGEEPNPALADMAASAGAGARIVDGTLPDVLTDLAIELGQRRRDLPWPGYDVEMDHPGLRRTSLRHAVEEALAEPVSPVRATVVLASIADAAGSTDAAFRLLSHTMPFHLKAGLLEDPAMPEQLAMIAATLIDVGHIDAELSGDRFKGELTARQVLSMRGDVADPLWLALVALAEALCGYASESDIAGLRALRGSREQDRLIVRVDTIHLLARGWIVAQRWDPAKLQTRRKTYEMVRAWGDEPRRAQLGASLAQYLIEAGELDDAFLVLADCKRVSNRLKLFNTANDLAAALGRWCLVRGDIDTALRHLDSACFHHRRNGQHLRLALALLVRAEAATRAGDAKRVRESIDLFEHLLPLMPGLALARTASRVRMWCAIGAFDEAREAVAELRELEDSWGFNVWIGLLADRLSATIDAEASKGA